MNAVVHPGETAAQAEIPALRRASPQVFSERARRFARLAQGHPMEAYLVFMGHLAAAQQIELAADEPGFAAPEHDVLLQMRRAGRPPLTVDGWLRARPWQHILRRLLAAIAPHAPVLMRPVIDRLVVTDDEALEVMARRALHGADPMHDPVVDPLLAAALQVYWVRLAAALDTDDIAVPQPSPVCPVCGSAPVASVMHGSGAVKGLRYLHCGLCETEWHLSRIRCSHCDDEKGVVYFAADEEQAVVRAEACESCHSYLKVVHCDKDAAADPVADDLASLSLDMAMAAEGFARSGPNLLFVPGEDIRTAN